MPKAIALRNEANTIINLSVFSFSSSASLQCVCTLISWIRCFVHHLQHHLNAASEKWEFPWASAEICSATNNPGTCSAPESSCYVFANSYQISLHFQSTRFIQYLSSKNGSFSSWALKAACGYLRVCIPLSESC